MSGVIRNAEDARAFARECSGRPEPALPPTGRMYLGDNLEWMRQLPDRCVDLVITSPPYEGARLYKPLEYTLKGEDWVRWAFERYMECLRICRGLVAWVVDGQTREYRWSCAPMLLAADLHRAGVNLRRPAVFHRIGIPGSGGTDWWRGDSEFILCASHGRLPWAEPTATGSPPKWGPGGEMSHRLTNGTRRNQWGHSGAGTRAERRPDGTRGDARRPSHRLGRGHTKASIGPRMRVTRGTGEDGQQLPNRETPFPDIANPGNVIDDLYVAEDVAEMIAAYQRGDVLSGNVGGGHMGSRWAHENEAPFPEWLVEPFIACFCPPGGIVLDIHAGSGTTCSVAERLGRQWIGVEARQSQIDLTLKRLEWDRRVREKQDEAERQAASEQAQDVHAAIKSMRRFNRGKTAKEGP